MSRGLRVKSRPLRTAAGIVRMTARSVRATVSGVRMTARRVRAAARWLRVALSSVRAAVRPLRATPRSLPADPRCLPAMPRWLKTAICDCFTDLCCPRDGSFTPTAVRRNDVAAALRSRQRCETSAQTLRPPRTKCRINRTRAMTMRMWTRLPATCKAKPPPHKSSNKMARISSMPLFRSSLKVRACARGLFLPSPARIATTAETPPREGGRTWRRSGEARRESAFGSGSV